jgi:hypothetical protein
MVRRLDRLTLRSSERIHGDPVGRILDGIAKGVTETRMRASWLRSRRYGVRIVGTQPDDGGDNFRMIAPRAIGTMIPAGYMYKTVARRPEWLGAKSVLEIYSVSSCVSEDFCDFTDYWKHNGYWFFNSPSVMQEIAVEVGVDVALCKLFYYQVYEFEFDQTTKTWKDFAPEASFATDVVVPDKMALQGFDVATFLCGNSPECSPLSCNSLATEIPVNRFCLFDTFDEAKTSIDVGRFGNSERGPLRIFAVYSDN